MFGAKKNLTICCTPSVGRRLSVRVFLNVGCRARYRARHVTTVLRSPCYLRDEIEGVSVRMHRDDDAKAFCLAVEGRVAAS